MAQNSIEIRDKIKLGIENALKGFLSGNQDLANIDQAGLISKINIDKPADISRGDYSTSIALIAGKIIGKNPIEFAVSVTALIQKDLENKESELSKIVSKVEVAGVGFINFYLNNSLAGESVISASKNSPTERFGKIDLNLGKKIAYEYTDPNPFKVFHIGHLMANMVGESLSRLGEFTKAEIKRFCYQGDLGRHVALFVYGLRFMDDPFPTEEDVREKNMSLTDLMYYMGKSYAKGATYFKEHPEIEDEIQAINKKLYEKSDEEINTIYNLGLNWSLEYFETLYDRLGTKFDQYFFESKCVEPAFALIKEGKEKGVFSESDGAIVFEGEKFQDDSNGEKFHTRVFITKFGLPTYDAKELGLAQLKYQAFKYDRGIVVTANEQDQYFKVNLKVQSIMLPETANKNTHISHGMMVLPTGKMSSRTGDVVSAEEMLEQARTQVLEIMKGREISDEEKLKISDQIAIAGIKYLVLRQSTNKNVIYDAKKALSFDGDSGPYLQYATVRAKTVIEKAKSQGLDIDFNSDNKTDIYLKHIYENELALNISKKIFGFHDVIERAYLENAPHYISTYLIELAGQFNHFYTGNKIIDTTDESSKEKSIAYLYLTKAVSEVLENGLYILGISVPARM